MRRQTWASRTKEATSMIARSLKMCMSISPGRVATGHGGTASPMVGGAGSIDTPEKPAMSCLIDGGVPSKLRQITINSDFTQYRICPISTYQVPHKPTDYTATKYSKEQMERKTPKIE
jgi:hypothetical protein